MSSEQKPYVIHTKETPLKPTSHRLNPKVHREQLRLGDLTGLTKTGVHLCRVPPHNDSTVLHWHSNEDEWVYIVSAGAGAVMRIKEGDKEVEHVPIKEGDFFGFPAGSRNAHALKSGEGEIVYLVGGSRETLDVCTYPEVNVRGVLDRTPGGKSWDVGEEAVVQT
ncbi:hypothetical protein GLOTRDRAFT_111776 [Gloeophyllum trabeum ATCC 11539]|uniref:Cupin type-2 domain-containing protein n=1 Tax=Gloeophyllum trabeum (strain ATCC 11539 / FP-39264 / Madison 617) TaxID=670483 RepID=S7Q1C9_GLOTA|nr:uncharacterized protein GLOTRDRAFT_111776 [Gloeophyllum trabeum ATCC 11539]EPQ53761.1 hypothetical protein GLOTRDRAFT_111776 [Gloeophyllum trabeum ATCC 11539]